MPLDRQAFVETSALALARQALAAGRRRHRRGHRLRPTRSGTASSASAKATRKLAFTPVDLTHTPFAQFESLGGRAESVVDVPYRLYRGFRMPDGHQVTLFEHDMSADGSRSWRDPKDESERINGLPARLVVMEASSGKAVSLLSWFEGRRGYQLWVDANVVRVPLRDRLFALASSPKQPVQIPLRPILIGPDAFPIHPVQRVIQPLGNEVVARLRPIPPAGLETLGCRCHLQG